VTAGYLLATLSLAYAAVLTVGLYTLPSPDQPIRQPWFTWMELLILGIAPAMVTFMVALHARAPDRRKSVAVLGIAFMSMCATVTCGVHFVILALGRQPLIGAAPWSAPLISFKWPSLVYALDILAWDFFFPLAAICAAITVTGSGLAATARVLLVSSAVLALAGLVGVPLNDMSIRNVGIVGYAGLFPIASLLLARLFSRSAGREPRLSGNLE